MEKGYGISSLVVDFYHGIMLTSSINTCCFRSYCIVLDKRHIVQILLNILLSGLTLCLIVCVCQLFYFADLSADGDGESGGC